jgi:hypothetical protein
VVQRVGRSSVSPQQSPTMSPRSLMPTFSQFVNPPSGRQSTIAWEYFVLLLLMRQTNQLHQLPLTVWLLPLLYPGPLVIGLAFKRNLKGLLRKELLTAKAVFICNDWITLLLCLVYGMLLEFRLLH